ncbi:hypothetical protein [Rhodoferax sp.]|uniref:hypothetical protein n=1 Tax=Rhodoferax sp. TaxID=50421 RepID=UPI00283E8807|nr:hypothetical protein [Rhodoferax sp.]MDR3368603.1 hypothetical protein [Rhodoferax sp.]
MTLTPASTLLLADIRAQIDGVRQRVADAFLQAQILHTLCSQLSWSHLRLIIQIDEPLKQLREEGQIELYLRFLEKHRGCQLPDPAATT